MQTQNALTTALVSAGFPAMPLNKRVWLWLRDHPGKTCREISDAIGALAGDVSVALLDLHRRKMVARNKTKRLAVNGTRMTIFEHTTCIREYELLPLPVKKTENHTPTAASATAFEMTRSAIQSQIAATARIAIDHTRNQPTINIKDLPLSEALRLYGELKAVFGDRA